LKTLRDSKKNEQIELSLFKHLIHAIKLKTAYQYPPVIHTLGIVRIYKRDNSEDVEIVPNWPYRAFN
jgi:hypothetical protein